MAVKNIIKAIPLTSINSATFTGAYQAINPLGLPNACTFIKIVNNSTVDVTVSYDGTNDHDFIQTNSAVQFPFQANAQPSNWAAILAQGTIIYVKGAAGANSVYLVGYFNPQGV